MKMKPCPECGGRKTVEAALEATLAEARLLEENEAILEGFAELFADSLRVSPTCDGTGTIPDEPVNHCQACGEPILPSETWCNFHKAAAELEGRGDE